MAKDPICGMDVEPKDAAATYEYEGETFYFCAVGCKDEFARNPEKYLDKEESKGGCCG